MVEKDLLGLVVVELYLPEGLVTQSNFRDKRFT